jgi:hypothetical protein
MTSSARRAGAAVVVVAVAYAMTWVLEIYRGSLGFEDADNPATMLAFLRDYSNVYTLSGLAWVLMALALLVAVLCLWDAAGEETGGLLLQAGTMLGLLTGRLERAPPPAHHDRCHRKPEHKQRCALQDACEHYGQYQRQRLHKQGMEKQNLQ